MGLILFIIYAAAVLTVTALAARHFGGQARFTVNNRDSSAWQVGFSIVVSCVGASATIGTVGLAFQAGTPAFWWLGSGAAGLCVLGLVLAEKVRKSGAGTIPELMASFFTPKARLAISIIIVVAWLSILAAQFVALGRVTASLTGLNPTTAMIWGALLIAVHTLMGGQAGIIRLDRWQAIFLAIGLALTCLWLGDNNRAVLATVPLEMVNDKFPLSRLIYFFVVLGGSYVVCPMLFGRLLSAKNEAAARRGALGAAAGLVIISAVIVLIGLQSRGLIPPNTPGDQVLTLTLNTVFPGWLAIIVQVVLLSALVSSADSCLLTAGLIMSRDIFMRNDILTSRICLMFLSILGLLLTLTQWNILDFLLMANDVYVCGVVGPVFIALVAGGSLAAKPVPAMAGIILGGGLGLISAVTQQPYFSYAGLLLSVCLTLISLPRKTGT